MLTAESELLSPAEIRCLTDCARFEDQRRALDGMGLPCRVVGKRLKVSRYHLREWLSGRPVKASREPDLSAVS